MRQKFFYLLNQVKDSPEHVCLYILCVRNDRCTAYIPALLTMGFMRIQRSYLVLTLLWFTYFWSFFCQQVVIALMPAIQESLSLSTSAIGLRISLFSLGFVTGFLVAGFLCAKLGRIKTIVLNAVIIAFSVLFLSLSSDYLSISVLDTFLGLCTGIYPPAGLSLISDLFSSKKRGKYIGIHEAAVPAGMTLGPVFAGLMLNFGLGWNGIFQLCIVPSVIILISLLTFFRVKDGQTSPYDEPPAGTTSRPTVWAPIYFIILIAVYFFRGATTSEVSLLPEYWVSDFGVEVGASAFIFGIMRVFSIFGQVGVGYLSDIFGRLRVLFVLQIFGAILLIPTSYLAFGPLLFASYAGFSILSNSFMPVMFALISDKSLPRERPKNIGMVMSIGGISSIISPIILGLLAESYSFRIAWIYPIATGFISIPLLLLLSSSLDK